MGEIWNIEDDAGRRNQLNSDRIHGNVSIVKILMALDARLDNRAK